MMSLRTLINVILLAVAGYAAYSAYQYWQLRNTIMTELKGQAGIYKMIGDLESIKINISQYPAVSCADKTKLEWWEFVLKRQSKGCQRFTMDLQSDMMKTLKLSADYDTSKLIGERFSYVMICKKPGEVSAKDNGMPREYLNCE